MRDFWSIVQQVAGSTFGLLFYVSNARSIPPVSFSCSPLLLRISLNAISFHFHAFRVLCFHTVLALSFLLLWFMLVYIGLCLTRSCISIRKYLSMIFNEFIHRSMIDISCNWLLQIVQVFSFIVFFRISFSFFLCY